MLYSRGCPPPPPPCSPALAIYDTSVRGIAKYGDPNHAPDLLDLKAAIEPLGRGIAGCRVADAPNYIDMLQFVCRKLSWNPQEFRVYRCAMDHPIYGSQLGMMFSIPPAITS